MEKMNNRGFIEVMMLTVVGIVLGFIILTIFLSNVSFENNIITSTKHTINKDMMLQNLLRTKVDDSTLQKIILEDVIDDNFERTKNSIDNIMEITFGNRYCWRMQIDGKEIESMQNCDSLQDIDVDMSGSNVILPRLRIDNAHPVEVRFYHE